MTEGRGGAEGQLYGGGDPRERVDISKGESGAVRATKTSGDGGLLRIGKPEALSCGGACDRGNSGGGPVAAAVVVGWPAAATAAAAAAAATRARVPAGREGAGSAAGAGTEGAPLGAGADWRSRTCRVRRSRLQRVVGSSLCGRERASGEVPAASVTTSDE